MNPKPLTNTKLVSRRCLTHQLLPNLGVGLTTGVIGVLFNFSFAALIFSGSLAGHLSAGLSIVLLSAAVTRVIIAVGSSFTGSVADLGTVPTAILAWSAAAIAKDLSASAPPAEIFLTILVAIALTSLATGACLLALGLLNVGEIVRSVPHPVIGGFVASTGWLLVSGAFKVMTNQPLAIAQLPFLSQREQWVQWLPGLLLGLYLLVISRRRTHPLILLVSLLAAVGVFYLLPSLSATAQASSQTGLLGAAPAPSGWQFLSLATLTQVHWSAIANQLTCLATVVVVSAISLLMNVSGLELVTDQAINVNRELKVAGIANLVVGLGAGILSYHSLSKSVLAHKMGGSNRVASFVTAGVFAIVSVWGSSFLSHFPRPVLGGLLLFLGLSLLAEWSYDAWFKLSKADYWIVQLILVVSSTLGFLQGLALGWAVAGILFVVSYSRIYAIQPGVSGPERPSSAQRSQPELQVLHEQGEQIYVLEPQGVIFFGTANSLVNQVHQRIAALHLKPVRFIVIDFGWVRDIDSSAALSLVRIQQMTHRHETTLIFTHLSSAIWNKLQREDQLDTAKPQLKFFPTLDQGLEWCENQILGTELEPHPAPLPLASQSQEGLQNHEPLATLSNYLEWLPVSTNQWLFRQGDPPKGVYWVASGQVSLVLELPKGQTELLQTFGAGEIVGAGDFYWDVSQAASLRADRPSHLHHLSKQALGRMEMEAPELAAEFHKLITNLVSQRGSHGPSMLFQRSVEPRALDLAFIERCRQELVYCIGPIANFLLKQALAQHTPACAEHLVDALSAEIPDPSAASEFRQRLLS